MSDPLQTALALGQQLVDHCNQGQFREAIETLYADDAQHVEAAAMGPDMPQVTAGKAAILERNDWWEGCHEVHGLETKGPYPHGSGNFIVWMWLDVTAQSGPMKDQRMQMDEACYYTVKDGKIIQVDFHWDPTMDGA